MPNDNWTDYVGIAITVTDAQGTIVAMNPKSVATFAADGGAELIGNDVLACHPEPSRSRLERMYETQQANHYTIRKNGQRKIIHQIPLFDNGEFRGYVELSIPIPEEMAHFDRG